MTFKHGRRPHWHYTRKWLSTRWKGVGDGAMPVAGGGTKERVRRIQQIARGSLRPQNGVQT